MLKVLINKDPKLSKISRRISKITAQDKQFFKKMLNVMHREKGIGLAAVQVGVLKQMITIDIGSGPLLLANPTIVKKKGIKESMEEGCLSLPGITVKVRRPPQVVVEATDISGQIIQIEASDLLARVLQHEIDHLNGRLIIDYLSWHKCIALKRKMS